MPTHVQKLPHLGKRQYHRLEATLPLEQSCLLPRPIGPRVACSSLACFLTASRTRKPRSLGSASSQPLCSASILPGAERAALAVSSSLHAPVLALPCHRWFSGQRSPPYRESLITGSEGALLYPPNHSLISQPVTCPSRHLCYLVGSPIFICPRPSSETGSST